EMSKTTAFGFQLEVDNRTEEEKAKQRAQYKDGSGSSNEAPKAPMDTDYQEEMDPLKPLIRFNPNFDKRIRGVTDNDNRRGLFTRERLFEAVASGDVSRLDGLQEYFQQNNMRLSDSLYQSYGKTCLMKALMHLRDGKNPTVERLIEISTSLKPSDIHKFVNAAYTQSYYEGQTALHIAIERRSMSYVQLLVSKGADVHAKACGKFFQPHDGPNFYFGELPLSLAACTNQPEMVDFLMLNEYKMADPKEVDSHGNTVLHTLVIIADNSKENTKENTKANTEFITSMYDRILRTSASVQPKVKLEDIENHNGLTPLKLAAKTGKLGLFSHILKREFHEPHTKHLSRKFTEWVYGPVQSSLYDLNSVDSFEENSVLEILVYGNGIPNRHEMLENEPIIHLLDEKWKTFAGGLFFFNFICFLLYLIVFTAVAYNKKDNNVSIVLRTLYYATVLIELFALFSLIQALLFMAAAGLYMCGRQEYLGFLVLCLALSWVNLLYYSRGDKHMGIYSVMIQKMILSDILRFLFVYVVFLFGFSAAVVSLLIEPPPLPEKNTTKARLFFPVEEGHTCVKPSFRNISYTTLELFKFTIGMGDMEFTEHYQYKEVFYVLLIGYIILTYILLLNMLIALMNRTVEKLTLETTSIWKLQVRNTSYRGCRKLNQRHHANHPFSHWLKG
uniref:Transient receptor potential cation channel, subfamily V, member 1 n=1 Tax=Neogobius melanostomus TaxID=47308 RepID=A0A8C6S5P5_9GOBI